MMKVLMVGPDSQAKGGMATVIANFRQYDQKNALCFLTSWTESKRFLTAIKAILQIRKQIRCEHVKIVHFHVAQRGSFFRKALLAQFVPHKCCKIFHIHASQFDLFFDESPRLVQKIIKHVLRHLDGIVVLSEEWATYYRGLTDTEITVIENAVIVPESYVYRADSKKIVTFGRLGKRKGSYDLLKIAKQIEDRFPEIQFILCGDGEIAEIREEIKALKLKNVIAVGWLYEQEREQLLSKALIHILPSYQEGLPMAILESMAKGIPNLATVVGGIPSVIEHGQNGYLIQPGDTVEAVKLLQRFLIDENERCKLAEEAHKTIRKRFSLTEYFEKWRRFYDQIAQKE